MTISQVAVAGAGLSISGQTLPLTVNPSQSVTFTASFAPMATGSVTGSATVTSGQLTSPVVIPMTGTGVAVAPTITSQPASIGILVNQTATFAVSASGTAPLTYQWRKNGVAISGATSSSYTTPAETTADNGAQFTVIVSNSAGSAISNAAVLTVTASPIAPTITTQPSNQTTTAGNTATFSVVASGTSPLSYQWKKNGTAISGATSSTYTTPVETTSDNGAQFVVTVSNSAGSVSSNAATLTVNPDPVAPTITTQPASRTIIAGQTATFSVTASGTAPLGYQWAKNGTTISGATSSSYTTPAEATSDNGAQFTVTVSNTAGSVTSNAAILTVNASGPGALNPNTSSLNFGNVLTGNTSNLSVVFTNAGSSNITISNVSVTGAGFSGSGISAGQVITPGGTATLTVTFAPTSTGTVTGATATVTSNASNSPSTISLNGTGVTGSSVTLTWSPSLSIVSGYNVYRSTSPTGPFSTPLNSSLITATQYVDASVVSGTTYYYVATAVNASGVESANSNQASATIP